MIEIVKAPPFATVQDLGWRTGRAMGLPTGGAMHPRLLEAANLLIGNPGGFAGLEWALGPGLLRFLDDAQVCVTRDAEVRIGDAVQRAGVIGVGAGAPLQIIPRGRDRFIYVAVRGGIEVPPVMGSRSTYLPGGFGGLEGRRLRNGDRLQTGVAPRPPRGPTAARTEPPDITRGDLVLRATRGPQWELFGPKAREAFFAGEYAVTPASDRMGYRLKGPAVHPRSRATLPSEAACPGAVQIPDGGEPIVLMPDGPTVGGYPKLAVVIPGDLGELAQCQPGRAVRFREVSLEEARSLRR
ncbi:MAG TPA: biotin-dependent carboxyltransferase family protein [Gemmatimonadales bacterium]|nr:biotin-dependent carboxyltransferase family protein [Gemmatimonadales bacterium]